VTGVLDIDVIATTLAEAIPMIAKSFALPLFHNQKKRGNNVAPMVPAVIEFPKAACARTLPLRNHGSMVWPAR
jgi:hypothetical protein